MARYVHEVLQEGEVVAFESTVHWLVYLPAMVFGFILIVGVWLMSRTPDSVALSWVLILFGGACGLISFVHGWFSRWTTEIAATNRRIIYKRGFVRRKTVEMNMDKVESVDVDQSILGRIFDYGDILVRGTGTGLEPLLMIQRPIAFRNAVIAR